MTLTVKLSGIEDGQFIDPVFATCTADGVGGVRPGGNRSPAISWSGAPKGTRSFAIVATDRDVPADFSQANKRNVDIPADAERKAFYHWLLVDIPAEITGLTEGQVIGTAGRNSMGDKAKGANGYDGPCPPFNDERIHTYHFNVYALDIDRLDLKPGFSGAEAVTAIAGHILDQGEAAGRYTTNPHLKAAA